jgi:hypothetical protein
MSYTNSIKTTKDDRTPLAIILLEVVLFAIFVFKMFDG